MSISFQSTRPRGARRHGRSLFVHVDIISIHAPARGATGQFLPISPDPRFQSTRPRGARLYPLQAREYRSMYFNPRARAGRDGITSRSSSAETISIHAPTRGATVAGIASQADDANFNPRAHAGRDRAFAHLNAPTAISIHAPTRGATSVLNRSGRLAHFNPRAHAGRDFFTTAVESRFRNFNPRARAGRDAVRFVTKKKHLMISIHAPARGATENQLSYVAQSTHFNPRARAGRDLKLRPKCLRSQYFNPRARAGRDLKRGSNPAILRISIHAPARGATRDGLMAITRLIRFQSTRPRGARHQHRRRSIMFDSFQSTRGPPAAGRRHLRARAAAIVACAWHFNPRARAGRDGRYSISIVQSKNFNPRARAGRDCFALSS